MAFSSLPTIAQNDPITVDYLNQIKANFDDHESRLTSAGETIIPNGGFETDSNSDGNPDNWTLSLYTGGSAGLTTTSSASGARARYYTHPGGAGNGGGYDMSDYVPCTPNLPVTIGFEHWATAAGMKNQVILYWYQRDKTASATPSTTIYDSTSNPTSPTWFARMAMPPSDARFFRVRIVGGESSVNVAGTAYFDSVRLLERAHWVESGNTIAEQTTSSASWVDAGYFGIDLPSLSANSLVLLRFNAETKIYAATGGQRFRVGSAYSRSNDTSSTTYVPFAYELLLAGQSGTITVFQQLYAETGGSTYGRKTDGNVSITILIP